MPTPSTDSTITGEHWDGRQLGAIEHSRVAFIGADLRGSDLTGINPLTVSLRGAAITWDQAVQVAESLGLDVRPDDAWPNRVTQLRSGAKHREPQGTGNRRLTDIEGDESDVHVRESARRRNVNRIQTA